ncbi:nucleotidyltransferase domain-containing protein [Arthrobacter sp. UYCu723]
MLAGLVVEASRAMERFTQFLAAETSRWTEQPLQVTLFGSAARREMRNDSDIDLLFVVPDGASDQLYEGIGDLAVDAYRLTGNDVRPVVYEVSEVHRAPVFDSIDRDGVHIFGDSRWLSRRLHALAVA